MDFNMTVPWMLSNVSTFITSMANFSVQYNFACISVVLILMSQSVCTTDDGDCRDGTQADWVEGSASAAVFVGAVCGEIGFGFLGDYLTRSDAMLFAMSLALFGTIISAFFSLGSPASIYSVIIVFRFVMGIGLGGIFPLSATKASEDSSHSSGKVNSEASSWSFFWQLPALLLPWLIALGVTSDSSTLSTQSKWRFILGFGMVPISLTIAGLVFEKRLLQLKAQAGNINKDGIDLRDSRPPSVNNLVNKDTVFNPALSTTLNVPPSEKEDLLQSPLSNSSSIPSPRVPSNNNNNNNNDNNNNNNDNNTISGVNPVDISFSLTQAAHIPSTLKEEGGGGGDKSAKTAHHHHISLQEIGHILYTQPDIRIKLLACGGSWFIYDVVTYGLGLLSGYTISAIDADDDNISSDRNLQSLSKNQLIALAATIPATMISIKLVPILGLKYLQILGFSIISIACLLIAASFESLDGKQPHTLFGLYCFCYATMNFGAGVTTFSMPAALFPKEIRATFNGLSAAMGKCGAVVSTFSFYLIAVQAGYPVLLSICTIVAFLGAVLTWWLIDDRQLLSEQTNQHTSLFSGSAMNSVDHHSSFSANSDREISSGTPSTYRINDARFHTVDSSLNSSTQSAMLTEAAIHNVVHDPNYNFNNSYNSNHSNNHSTTAASAAQLIDNNNSNNNSFSVTSTGSNNNQV
jgi:MFS transporter, PHS family, inorganic phosphate transporter